MGLAVSTAGFVGHTRRYELMRFPQASTTAIFHDLETILAYKTFSGRGTSAGLKHFFHGGQRVGDV